MELLREDAGDVEPRRFPDGENGLFPAPPPRGIGDRIGVLLYEEAEGKVFGGCNEYAVCIVLLLVLLVLLLLLGVLTPLVVVPLPLPVGAVVVLLRPVCDP